MPAYISEFESNHLVYSYLITRLLFLGYKVMRSLRLWGFKVTNPDGLSFLISHFSFLISPRSYLSTRLLIKYRVQLPSGWCEQGSRKSVSCLCEKNFAVHFKLGVGTPQWGVYQSGIMRCMRETPQWDVSTLDAAYKQAFESNQLVYSLTLICFAVPRT